MGESDAYVSAQSSINQVSASTIKPPIMFEAEVLEIELSPSDATDLGKIKFTRFSEAGREGSGFAYPMYPHMKQYPVLHEVVIIFLFFGDFFYITPLNFSSFINNNVFDSATGVRLKPGAGGSGGYRSTEKSGVPKTNAKEEKKLGQFFKDANTAIAVLKPQEGDLIFQGRFGNSIRIGNRKESGLPNIKIGNIIKQPSFKLIEENLDKDDCIWITTDEPLSFKPIGPKSDKRNSYPPEMKTKQITVFSDRLLFVAKQHEILFHSNLGIYSTCNKNYGIDTDSLFILNAKKNIEFSTPETYNVKAKKSVILETDNTYIGKPGADEPLFLGNKAIALMGDILDEIQKIIVPTGTGPSGTPINAAKFAAIKSKLNTIISKKNFTD